MLVCIERDEIEKRKKMRVKFVLCTKVKIQIKTPKKPHKIIDTSWQVWRELHQ
jgi:hypothetical protein